MKEFTNILNISEEDKLKKELRSLKSLQTKRLNKWIFNKNIENENKLKEVNIKIKEIETKLSLSEQERIERSLEYGI